MLIAVAQVRDELQLLPLCVTNLLQQGVDAVLVADHGSTDGTAEWLAETGRADPRVQWTRNNDPGFHQADAMTALARVAVGAGAEWVLPVDADELWVAADASMTLAEVLAAHPAAAALGVRTEHFPAPHDLEVFGVGDLHRFTRRFVHSDDEVVAVDDIRDLVAGRHSYIPHTPAIKWVVRAHDGIDVSAGAHTVSHAPGTTELTDQVRLLHVPLRDRRCLAEKRSHGERLRASGYDLGHGWQEQMLVNLTSDDDWARFWRANSVDSSGRIPTGAPCDALIDDDALVRAAERVQRATSPPVRWAPRLLRDHGLLLMQTLVGEQRRGREESSRLGHEGDRLAAALAESRREVADLAEQVRAGGQGLMRAESRIAERAASAARLERELAGRVTELGAMQASRSWRLTRPLRRLARRAGGLAATPPVEDPTAWAEGLVDRAWYLATYPDVAEAGVDPVRHYAEDGLEEGRIPRPGDNPSPRA